MTGVNVCYRNSGDRQRLMRSLRRAKGDHVCRTRAQSHLVGFWEKCMDCMCVYDNKIPPITIFTFPINTGTHGRLGFLGFALAKGLIRGLVNRYPDPSQPPWSTKSKETVRKERSILDFGGWGWSSSETLPRSSRGNVCYEPSASKRFLLQQG